MRGMGDRAGRERPKAGVGIVMSGWWGRRISERVGK